VREETMPNDTQDSFSLDEISLQILLLLSGGSSLNLRTIAKALQKPETAILYGILSLENRGFISKNKSTNSYQITEKGVDYLALNYGMQANVRSAEESTNKPGKKISWAKPLKEFFIWTVTFIWLAILGIIASSVVLVFLVGRFWESALLALLFLIVLFGAIRVVKQSTTLVIFRFGICIGAKGPGPVIKFPIIDKSELVELKVDHNKIPGEACITKDNVQIKVDFVYYWQIKDAVKSVTEVTNATDATKLLATGALRAVIAGFTFSDLQEQRQDLNKKLQNEIDVYSSKWGIYVTNVEIQEVKTSDEIRKAMEDWRAAKWKSESVEILAKGQAEALKKLYTVANIIDSNTLNLKYFEMLVELGKGESTKYIFPMELSNLLQSWTKKNNGDQGDKKNDTLPELPGGTDLTKK